MSEMERNEELQKELKDLSFGSKVVHRMNAPEGYFDQLPDQVMKRWKQESSKPPARLITLKRMLATAAMVSGVCIGVVWWTNQSAQPAPNTEISSSEAYQYIIENIDDFAPLILQEDQWSGEIKSIHQDPSAIEEYLIEELDGEDFETIF